VASRFRRRRRREPSTRGAITEGAVTVKGILVFSGSGPLLIVSSYPTVDDERLIARLRAKGLQKFMAWEIPIDRCRDLYGFTYRDILEDLQTQDDLRVLDFDGHRIFLNFSLRDLHDGVIYEDERVSVAA
jgi:hypothetical protein